MKFYFLFNNEKCRPVSDAFLVSARCKVRAEMHANALVAAHAFPTRVISRPLDASGLCPGHKPAQF